MKSSSKKHHWHRCLYEQFFPLFELQSVVFPSDFFVVVVLKDKQPSFPRDRDNEKNGMVVRMSGILLLKLNVYY